MSGNRIVFDALLRVPPALLRFEEWEPNAWSKANRNIDELQSSPPPGLSRPCTLVSLIPGLRHSKYSPNMPRCAFQAHQEVGCVEARGSLHIRFPCGPQHFLLQQLRVRGGRRAQVCHRQCRIHPAVLATSGTGAPGSPAVPRPAK